MNTNLRALIFGTVVAGTLVVTLDTVVAAERTPVIRLDTVQVTGHRDAYDADGNLEVVKPSPISVIAHRTNIVAA